MRLTVEDLVGCELVEIVWLIEGVPSFTFRCPDGKLYRYDPPIPCEGYGDHLVELE